MKIQFSGIRLSMFQMGQLCSRSIVTEIANSNFPVFYLATFPRLLLDCSDFSFSVSVIARKSCMTGSIRVFEKLNFTPKLSALAFLKVKLPNMTDWHTGRLAAKISNSAEIAFFTFWSNVTGIRGYNLAEVLISVSKWRNSTATHGKLTN